jgi:hypothetical protein
MTASFSRMRIRATLLTALALVLAGTIGGRPAQAAVPNSPPHAVDDVASTPSDTTVGIDVLANDSDPTATP